MYTSQLHIDSTSDRNFICLQLLSQSAKDGNVGAARKRRQHNYLQFFIERMRELSPGTEK